LTETTPVPLIDNTDESMDCMISIPLIRGLALAVAPYISGMPGSPRRPLRHAPGLNASPHLLNFHVVPLALITIATVAYLLGSIPFGYLLVRFFRGQDIRSVGSGNIGATNVLRSGARGLGLATFLLDVLKGCTAVWLGGLLASWLAPGLELRNAEALAAIFAVIGHMFPVWLGFRGGKGVATGFGVFLVSAPWAALAAIGVFFLVLALSRYVALGSIVGAASFPVFAWFLVGGDRPAFFIAAQSLVALLIIVMHHQNIRRLLTGTENRFGAKRPA
jgi:acyl phosphate:glycerol-3-phosphate acyltransferase